LGYVGLSVTAPGGATLPSPVHDDSALGASAGASAVPVPVVSGQQAWFEFTYPVACSTLLAPGQVSAGAPGECYQGASLGVLVPHYRGDHRHPAPSLHLRDRRIHRRSFRFRYPAGLPSAELAILNAGARAVECGGLACH